MPAPELTLEELQDIFHEVTVAMTGLREGFVRQAYQEEGAPAFTNKQDVAFLFVTTIEDPFSELQDVVYRGNPSAPTEAEERISYTRVIEVRWTLYGPRCFELAGDIQYKITIDSIRQMLSPHSIFPIPRVPAPRYGPYQFAGQSWQRADVRARFNVLTIRDRLVPLIESATITVIEAGGSSHVIPIEPVEEP